MHGSRHLAVQRRVQVTPFARRDTRARGQAHRLEHHSEPHGVRGKELTEERHRRTLRHAATRSRDRPLLRFEPRVPQHGAGENVLRFRVRRHTEPRHIDPDDPDAVDLLREELQRNTGRCRHAQVRHDDRVVLRRIGECVNSVANVLEQLARDERFGVERDVPDRASRAVEV